MMDRYVLDEALKALKSLRKSLVALAEETPAVKDKWNWQVVCAYSRELGARLSELVDANAQPEDPLDGIDPEEARERMREVQWMTR